MKKFIKLAFVAVIAAVAGYNVYQSQSVMNGMSDFALANVEALASGEGMPDYEIKEEKTWDEGPFEANNGYETIRWIYVYKITDCYGEGYVQCSFDSSADIKFL